VKWDTFYIAIFLIVTIFLLRPEPTRADSVIAPVRFVEPAGKITLADAIKAALENNPDISAATHEINARESAQIQEGFLANPTFFSEFEEFGGSGELSGDDALGTTVGVSQEIPLAGKRAKRLRVAGYETVVARLEYQAKILALTSDVKKRFLKINSLEQGLLLEKENIALLQDAHDVISRQIALGDISPLDEKKARVELALAKTALSRAKRELEMARIELASSWGSRDVHFDQIELIDLEIRPLPKESDLWQAVQAHPEIGINRIQIERSKVSLALAKADAIPDLEVEGGVKYSNESNEHAYFIGFSMPIPVFDRNKGGILEASEKIKVGKKELDSSTLRMRTELAVLLEHLQIIDAELGTTETTIIPAAQEAYEAMKKAYQAGEKDYLELLDSQRTLLEVRRRNLLLEMEHHELIADLEGITGQDLESFSRNYPGMPE
jgi:outer membrane protein, heavy metal efflux system